jgi:hypothetical protein
MIHLYTFIYKCLKDGVKCAQLFLILLLRMYREHEDTAQAEVKHTGDTD